MLKKIIQFRKNVNTRLKGKKNQPAVVKIVLNPLNENIYNKIILLI